MHEPTFRRATANEGLNPFRCEMVNVREQCSWVHEDREAATAKAIDLVRMMCEKVKRNEDLFPIQVPITRRALVVGGGIAGIQAALDLANAGIPVVMVEKEPSIGGHMSQLSETFPTLDCSQCILTPRMVEVAQHPLITLHTYSEVEKVEGFIGNFRVDDPQEGALRRHVQVHRLRRLPAEVPAEEAPLGLRRRAGEARRHLHPVPAGGARTSR